MKVRLIIIAMLCLCGCASYDITIGKARFRLKYAFQKKEAREINYDPNTHAFSVKSLDSETSQIIRTAITAALGGVR